MYVVMRDRGMIYATPGRNRTMAAANRLAILMRDRRQKGSHERMYRFDLCGDDIKHLLETATSIVSGDNDVTVRGDGWAAVGVPLDQVRFTNDPA